MENNDQRRAAAAATDGSDPGVHHYQHQQLEAEQGVQGLLPMAAEVANG